VSYIAPPCVPHGSVQRANDDERLLAENAIKRFPTNDDCRIAELALSSIVIGSRDL
jgi:hypothetical protein